MQIEVPIPLATKRQLQHRCNCKISKSQRHLSSTFRAKKSAVIVTKHDRTHPSNIIDTKADVFDLVGVSHFVRELKPPINIYPRSELTFRELVHAPNVAAL